MDDQTVSFRQPFRDPEAMPGVLPAGVVAGILAAAGDIVLVVDADGIVVDVAGSGASLESEGVAEWRDRPFIDLVTIESRPKIREMLEDAAAGEAGRWRQVNHPTLNGDLPIRYICVPADSRVIAIGRDMRSASAMQQRLLQAQQSLERDYLRLRQAESRYRLLFDLATEPVLIVDAASRRITEANPAAHRLLDLKDGALSRQPVSTIVAASEQEALVAHLGAAGAAGTVRPAAFRLATGAEAQVSVTSFRQDNAAFLLVRIAPPDTSRVDPPSDARLRAVIDRMPDAFVLTDRRLAVLAANSAFVELAQASSADRVQGATLSEWLGRPGIDLELILGQLREHGAARNVATIVRGSAGGQEEVEVSAVAVRGDDGDHYGFTIRSVARRLRDLPPVERDLPRSVEQLTELVGRMSLKEIVRESTDLIERLCIEAALTYTSDNRASAAEILGLSRQGLYSKLHRHGLGNLADGD